MAIALPAVAAGELDSAVGPLRPAWPELRWTGRDAWHLTLAFLGEVDEKLVGRLGPRLERAAAHHAPLSLSLGGAGAFPTAARARVLWTGVEGDREALEQSLKKYREARSAWAGIIKISNPVYQRDITVGENPQLRGHWSDRLAAIDADIALVAKQLEAARGGDAKYAGAIQSALSRPKRGTVSCSHVPAASFRPGQPLSIELSVAKSAAPVSARLYFRRVTQAERYQSAEMGPTDGRYRATVPGAYTDSPYPLEYYFELRQGATSAWLFPGFTRELTNQPYFVVRRG